MSEGRWSFAVARDGPWRVRWRNALPMVAVGLGWAVVVRALRRGVPSWRPGAHLTIGRCWWPARLGGWGMTGDVRLWEHLAVRVLARRGVEGVRWSERPPFIWPTLWGALLSYGF
jgi:hypothetical protein